MFGVIPLVKFLGVLGVDIDVHQKNPSTFVCHGSVLSVAYRLHYVASSRVHPPSRLKPMQDEHKLGSPLGRGLDSAVDCWRRLLGMVVPCPTGQRRVIGPPCCA